MYKKLITTFSAGALCLSGILFLSGCQKENEPQPEPTVYTVALDAQKKTIGVGKTHELTATVNPSEGANAVWKSSDEKVAKVTGSALKGTVTGISEGKTYIYCIVNEKFRDSCEVTVSLVIYPEAPEIPCIKINGTVWAPVNCGYDSTNYIVGKLYQWGRKYGQGYNDDAFEDGDYPAKIGGNQSFEVLDSALTEHPDGDTYNGKFYRGTKLMYWYDGISPEAVKLWNSSESGSAPVKTIYDPCPTGWRVPTEAELTSLIGSHTVGNLQYGTGAYEGQIGKWFNGSIESRPTSGVFLPVCGSRAASDGLASYRGSMGYYWSSSAKKIKVGKLEAFDLQISGSFARIWGNYTSLAFSVRCVQE